MKKPKLNILDRFCLEFKGIVEKYTEYIVVSGFVVISSGRTRATEDIDMIIRRIPLEKFKKMHKELSKTFECFQSDNPDEIYSYLDDNLSVRYAYPDKPIPQMELKFVKDPLDDYQFQTKTKLKLTGLDIWFSSVEMNIAFKEGLLKSDKDMEDAKHLRLVYEVDEKEIQKIKNMLTRYR